MSSPQVNTPVPNQSDDVGDSVSLNLASYLADADAGDSLSYAITGLPAGTGLSLSAQGVLNGTPTAADAAASPLLLTVTATDDGANTRAISVPISVTPTGTPPTGTPPASRGLYLIWYGNTDPLLNVSYVKGGQAYAEIAGVYNNPFFTAPNWSGLTADINAIDAATGGAKYFTLQLNPQKDTTMRRLVWYLADARATHGEAKVELDGDWISAFWDESGDGLSLMKKCWDAALTAFDSLLTAGQRSRCIGIRNSAGAIAVEGISPSTSAGEDISNYTRGDLANAATPSDYSTTLRDAALEGYYQYVIDKTFPSGVSLPAVYPIFMRPEIGNLSVSLNNQFDVAWNNNRMGIFVTNWTEEPYNNHSRDQIVKSYDVCRLNGNLRGLAEAHDENPGNHTTLGGANYSSLQRKWWGALSCLHAGYTWIYMRDEYVDLYGTATENQREWKEVVDQVNRYAGWHANPSSSPGAWLALREGNRFTSSDVGGGNYTHHMTQIVTGGGDRGTELWAGNGLFAGSDYVGRPSSATGSTTTAGAGQRQSIWAFEFSSSENLKVALDGDFAGSIDGGNITVFVHYLDVGTASFDLEVFGVTVDTITLTDTDDWIVAEYPLSGVTVAADSDGAHIVCDPAGDVIFHMIEVRRG